MARLEAQSDKDMGEDDDESIQSDQSTEDTADGESFIQLRRNIDHDNGADEISRLAAPQLRHHSVAHQQIMNKVPNLYKPKYRYHLSEAFH